jgi:hypothetical protein
MTDKIAIDDPPANDLETKPKSTPAHHAAQPSLTH